MASDAKTKRPLSLGRSKLELKKTVESGQVRQSFSHGRSKVVQVERKRKRQFELGADGTVQEVKTAPVGFKPRAKEELQKGGAAHGSLTDDEKAHRLKALQDAMKADEESNRIAEEDAIHQETEAKAQVEAATKVEAATAPEPEPTPAEPESTPAPTAKVVELRPGTPQRQIADEEDDEAGRRKAKTGHKPPTVKRTEPRRRAGKLTLGAALQGDELVERSLSLASVRRAADKERRNS